MGTRPTNLKLHLFPSLHCLLALHIPAPSLPPCTVLGKLDPGQSGPGQSGPGQLGPGQLGPGAQLSRAQLFGAQLSGAQFA